MQVCSAFPFFLSQTSKTNESLTQFEVRSHDLFLKASSVTRGEEGKGRFEASVRLSNARRTECNQVELRDAFEGKEGNLHPAETGLVAGLLALEDRLRSIHIPSTAARRG